MLKAQVMTTLHELIQVHLQRYPDAELYDLYKLIYQSVFGAAHPVVSEAKEREWTEHDLAAHAPDSRELLIENVSLDDSIVRVNLRPYQAAGGGSEALLQAYIESCAVTLGSDEQMVARWAEVVALVEQDKNLRERFDPQLVRLIGRRQAEVKWANVPHSATYNFTYRPVYRVMRLEIAKALCAGQGIRP